eukprot:gene10855-12064_t
MSIVCGARFPSKEVELLEDGRVFYFPHRVGRTILLFGKRSSFFPFQLFVGPDWPCMLVTYALVIVPTVLFINNIAVGWGGGVIFVTVLLGFSVLVFFTLTACSDPGIVFRTITDSQEASLNVELGGTEGGFKKMECTFCKLDRPWNASHCYDCGVCIVDLDHHCPWTGKCIGKKTLFTFRGFLVSLWLLIAFVVIFVIVTAVRHSPVFDFTPKSS